MESYQQSFAKRYDRYLKRIKAKGFKTEKEVRQSDAYLQLDSEAKAKRAEVQPQVNEINRRVKVIDQKLAAITDEFQNRRGHITVANYEIENSDEDDRAKLRREVEELKTEKAEIAMPSDDGSGKVEKQKLNLSRWRRLHGLKDRRAAVARAASF